MMILGLESLLEGGVEAEKWGLPQKEFLSGERTDDELVTSIFTIPQLTDSPEILEDYVFPGSFSRSFLGFLDLLLPFYA